MTKEELEARLNAAEKEIADLKAKLNEASEIPDYPEFNVGDFYCWLGTELKGQCSTRGHSNFTHTDFNEFHTTEYANIFADKCREIAMLLHCKWYVDRDYVPNWLDKNNKKYAVIFKHSKNKYIIGYGYFDTEDSNVHFSTEEAAQHAADWMNEHYNKERSD